MALDLYEQKETPIWKKALFAISILVLLTILVLFGYNQFSKIPKNNSIINNVSINLNSQGTEEQLAEKELVLSAEKKINIFKDLYLKRPTFNTFFNRLQTWTYPRIVFLSADINAKSAEVSLKGRTDSLQSIMQEMLILDEKEEILSYTISNIELSDNRATFDLSLKVNPELFQHQNEQQ
ncbi:MAG: hypothetical protein WC157_02130 [Candidatus Paceibacterota bacterium]